MEAIAQLIRYFLIVLTQASAIVQACQPAIAEWQGNELGVAFDQQDIASLGQLAGGR